VSDPLHFLLLLIPLIALRHTALAHWHLRRRIEPEPWRRAFGAAFQFGSALALWFSFYAALRSASTLLLGHDHPLIPILLSTALSLAINRWILKKPTRWRDRPPLLSKDRAYECFLRIVADRASEARHRPDRREAYFERLRRDDAARLQAVAAYMSEHRGRDWIALKPAQLAYHPDHNRLPWTLLYLAALAPVIVPLALSVIEPSITAQTADLTIVVTFLGTLLYGPLFEPQMRYVLFALAATLVIGMAILLEIPRLRAMTPGFAGLIMLTILGLIVVHYVESYVIAQTQTPLVRATDYLLAELADIEGSLRKFGGAARFLGYSDEVQTVAQYGQDIRQAVLKLQSAAGSLFILPALLFWGGLTFAAIWEMYASAAGDVTFRARMRKPLL
jgi:hypothetical protein